MTNLGAQLQTFLHSREGHAEPHGSTSVLTAQTEIPATIRAPSQAPSREVVPSRQDAYGGSIPFETLLSLRKSVEAPSSFVRTQTLASAFNLLEGRGSPVKPLGSQLDVLPSFLSWTAQGSRVSFGNKHAIPFGGRHLATRFSRFLHRQRTKDGDPGKATYRSPRRHYSTHCSFFFFFPNLDQYNPCFFSDRAQVFLGAKRRQVTAA